MSAISYSFVVTPAAIAGARVRPASISTAARAAHCAPLALDDAPAL